MKLSDRLKRLEQRYKPTAGGLPILVEVPTEGPERERVLDSIDRRRKRGENILAIRPEDDPLAILANVFAP